MGPYARADYNLTLCPLQSRLEHIYHGQPYARVEFIPQSGTLDLASDTAALPFLSLSLLSVWQVRIACSRQQSTVGGIDAGAKSYDRKKALCSSLYTCSMLVKFLKLLPVQ
jgi:hypothetical protein